MAVGGAVLLVLALIGLGVGLLRRPEHGELADPGRSGPTTAVGSVTASPRTLVRTGTARPTPGRTTARPRPTPTRKPPKSSLPPPPPTPTSTATAGPNCPTFIGPKAALSDVRNALTAAAGVAYWGLLDPLAWPVGLLPPMPQITVPVELMKAEAWQESGWQSTIVACDGGRGVMQVMPGTRDYLNARFGTGYDIDTLAGNAALGAEYLEWLQLYFGLYYFGSFDLSATAPVGTGGGQLRLLDVVVSAYNVGPGSLENADGTLHIPNPSYVDNVTTLMSTCVCLAY
jgi:transglycosylase-like protein with SLT domain